MTSPGQGMKNGQPVCQMGHEDPNHNEGSFSMSIIKKRSFLLPLLGLSLLGLLLGSPLLGAVTIQGKLSAPAGQSLAGLNVVLLEQNPNKPPRGPVAMTQSNEKGEYSLTLSEVDPTSRYVIGSRLGDERTGTDPFKIDPTKTSITVDLAFTGQGGQGGQAPHGNMGQAGQAAHPSQRIQGSYLVQGKLTSSQPRDFSGATLVLMELNMAQRSQKEVMMRKPGTDGSYRFELTEIDPAASYIVGLRLDRQVVGSAPFRLQGKKDHKTIDVEIPPVSTATDTLLWHKLALFFDVMEGYIQITEVLLVENPAVMSIDSYNNPIIKKIPFAATNFEAETSHDLDVSSMNGQVFIRMMMDQGQRQIVYAYRIPTDDTRVEMVTGLLPGMREVEMLRSSPAFGLDLPEINAKTFTTTRSHREQTLYTKKAPLSGNEESLKILISGLSMPQKKLVYPAAFLLVLLLSGLFWYIKIKPNRAGKTPKGA